MPSPEPELTFRVCGRDPTKVQFGADMIRNEFWPHVSTSRLLKSEHSGEWLCFVNIYQLKHGPKVFDPYKIPEFLKSEEES